MRDAVLTVSGLRKSYGSVVALDGVDLDVDRGEVVGLLGPNGAGKTTLVSISCGLRRADAGSVQVNGIDALAHPQQARHHIGLAPQDLGIYPVVTVRRNLELFGELAGLLKPALGRQIETVAAALFLDDLLDRKAGELSGGQKRRLHTAIALLNDPPLILLDESTTGADVETRAALIELVRELAHRGSAVLYSTHYLQEVEALDASVVIIERGKVIAQGSVDTLISHNGEAVVELTFDGSPPGAIDGYEVSIDGSVMRVSTEDPGRSMADILGSLGPDAAHLTGVEIIRPSLETVYLAVTGRRYEAGEDIDVAAS
ncbi:MAG: ABC transporter ATP-binding protein [Acidimicrobiia bacterium]|nr:MAG: ABC transporter ATP-binding protein [Acidimicrobiia bacterium]